MKGAETRQALENNVPRFASLTHRPITIKLTKLTEYDIQGEVLGVKINDASREAFLADPKIAR
jgi:hypothetical protein